MAPNRFLKNAIDRNKAEYKAIIESFLGHWLDRSTGGGVILIVKVDGNAVAAIEAILKRGNNAIVRRKGDGVVVMEEKRKTVYEPSPNKRWQVGQ